MSLKEGKLAASKYNPLVNARYNMAFRGDKILSNACFCAEIISLIYRNCALLFEMDFFDTITNSFQVQKTFIQKYVTLPISKFRHN